MSPLFHSVDRQLLNDLKVTTFLNYVSLEARIKKKNYYHILVAKDDFFFNGTIGRIIMKGVDLSFT